MENLTLQHNDSSNQKITLINDNFSNIEDIVNTHNFIPVDGVLFDLGLSSLQLETPNRGFSFKFDSFLDMRFNIHQELSAHQIINFSNEQELARIISEFGEQSRSKIIAKTNAKYLRGVTKETSENLYD